MKALNEITEDMMYEDGSSYFTTKDMEAEYKQMKTLNEITNGYLSIFERMAIMAVASRLDAATCCDNEAEDAHSKEFCDCVHCILCSYVVSGSLTAVEIPCDVSILLWVNAKKYVINWFNDYNVPYDDNDLDDDPTEDVVDTEITEDMMYPDCSSHFITKDMEVEYDPTDVSCKDCPDDECTGHCMSCCYR